MEPGVERELLLDVEVGPGYVQAVVTGEYGNRLTESEIVGLWARFITDRLCARRGCRFHSYRGDASDLKTQGQKSRTARYRMFVSPRVCPVVVLSR